MVEARSENVDLWPTVLELAGLPPLVDPDGRSLVADLTAVANSYFESRLPPWGTDAPTVEFDEMEMDQLRALGYGVQ